MKEMDCCFQINMNMSPILFPLCLITQMWAALHVTIRIIIKFGAISMQQGEINFNDQLTNRTSSSLTFFLVVTSVNTSVPSISELQSVGSFLNDPDSLLSPPMLNL